MKSLYPAREFRMARIVTNDGSIIEVPADVHNLAQIRPYVAILIVKTYGQWRFICEYWEENVAKEQAKVYLLNPANTEAQVLPYPVVDHGAPKVLTDPLLPLAKAAVQATKKAVKPPARKPTITVTGGENSPDPTVLPEPIPTHRRGRRVALPPSD